MTLGQVKDKNSKKPTKKRNLMHCILCDTVKDVKERSVLPRHRDRSKESSTRPLCGHCHDQYHWKPSNLASRKSKREPGSVGAPGYGYRVVNGRIIPIPQQIETVQRIIDLRLDGNNWQAIVQTLNSEGRPTARGGSWHSQVVISIFERECPDASRVDLTSSQPGKVATRYGFRLDDHGRLVEDEQEQRIVKWMARRRQAGETLERIAEKLNSHPVPTKRGGRWYGSTVSNILRRFGLPK